MAEHIVELEHVSKSFVTETSFLGKRSGYVHAVDDVNLTIKRGECLGLVGETGCGKSTLSRCIAQLFPLSAGKIRFNFERGPTLEFDSADGGLKRRSKSKKLRRFAQVVFQDPHSSMDPRMRIRDIIAEPMLTHHTVSRGEVDASVSDLLEAVGLRKNFMFRYPHEMSGGQLQRVAIARAVSLSPEFVILDEPTSSLDASVQIQVLKLLKEIRTRYKLTYLFITHNLSVVDYFCDRVAVMYLGKIVEIAPKPVFFKEPLHPYSKSLLAAIPTTKSKPLADERFVASGDLPSPVHPPMGCHYHPRCPVAFVKCGWEPRDFMARYLETLQHSISKYSIKENSLLLWPRKGSSTTELEDQVREIKGKDAAYLILSAIMKMSADEASLTLEFARYPPPTLTPVENGAVSCLLYSGDAQDAKVS